MSQKRPVPFPSNESTPVDMPKSISPTGVINLCGKPYTFVFDMQAIGMIIAATKHNPLTDGMGMAWLMDPKNLKATLRAGMQRHHGNNQPKWEELEAFITVKNVSLITLGIVNIYKPSQPTRDELIGIGIDMDALEAEAAEAMRPPSPPMLSSSVSGASDEATYE